jgi:hypothetical protein
MLRIKPLFMPISNHTAKMDNYAPQATAEPLHERHPDEWLRRIKELPEEIQPVIARVVWWDYYGSKQRRNAWTNLNEMRRKPQGKIPEVDQIRALIKLGYTAHKASKRIGCRYD